MRSAILIAFLPTLLLAVGCRSACHQCRESNCCVSAEPAGRAQIFCQPEVPCVDDKKCVDDKVDDKEVLWSPDDPIYSHATDYSWLIGKIQRVHVTGGACKIRFAPLDEVDRWGGSVVLATDARLDRFNDGDFVYVAGQIIADRPSLYLNGPLYRIDTVRPVNDFDRRRIWTARKERDGTPTTN